MGDLQLLARILTAPFRLAKSLFQTAAMTAAILILLFVAPFASFLTMAHYQHQTNQFLTSDPSRVYMLYDFSGNTAITVPWDNNFSGQPYASQVPPPADYKADHAYLNGLVPDDWSFWNLVGFYNDSDTWMRGKQAPMYAAYAQAATTSDELRKALADIKGWHNDSRPFVLPDAPKVVMAWRTATYPSVTLPVVLFGVAPTHHIEMNKNLHFNEAHDLFTPSLSDGQATALAQMLDTLKDDYWVREAHANGIYDEDDYMRERAKRSRDQLAIFYHEPTPAYWMVAFEMTYVVLVLSLIGVMVFHSRASSFGGSTPTVVPSTDTTPIRLRAETHWEERAASREEEEREQRQQERINRRLEEERQRAASQNKEGVPPPAAPSSNALAEHFATLGIPVDATDDQIKTAYRDLAMVWHPDRFGDGETRLKKKAEEQFKAIHAAYTYLQEHKPYPARLNDIDGSSLQKDERPNPTDEELMKRITQTRVRAEEVLQEMQEFLREIRESSTQSR